MAPIDDPAVEELQRPKNLGAQQEFQWVNDHAVAHLLAKLVP